MILYEPLCWLGLRQAALTLTVVVGQSAKASLASAAVVEQFARTSLVTVVDPISGVEPKLVSEVKRELFSLSV
jgi:hypothetical protein